MVALIAENVGLEDTGMATGVNTVVRMIGAVVGGQVGAAILTARTIEGGSTPAESAFTIAFGLSAGAALLAFVFALSVNARPVRRRLEAVEALDA